MIYKLPCSNSIWNFKGCIFLLLLISFSSCKDKEIALKPVSYSEFELFVNETGYISDAERYGWSIVQINVNDFEKVALIEKEKERKAIELAQQVSKQEQH